MPIPALEQASVSWPRKLASGPELIPTIGTVAPSGRHRSQTALIFLVEVNIIVGPTARRKPILDLGVFEQAEG